jgi:hypothetical protein
MQNYTDAAGNLFVWTGAGYHKIPRLAADQVGDVQRMKNKYVESGDSGTGTWVPDFGNYESAGFGIVGDYDALGLPINEDNWRMYGPGSADKFSYQLKSGDKEGSIIDFVRQDDGSYVPVIGGAEAWDSNRAQKNTLKGFGSVIGAALGGAGNAWMNGTLNAAGTFPVGVAEAAAGLGGAGGGALGGGLTGALGGAPTAATTAGGPLSYGSLELGANPQWLQAALDPASVLAGAPASNLAMTNAALAGATGAGLPGYVSMGGALTAGLGAGGAALTDAALLGASGIANAGLLGPATLQPPSYTPGSPVTPNASTPPPASETPPPADPNAPQTKTVIEPPPGSQSIWDKLATGGAAAMTAADWAKIGTAGLGGLLSYLDAKKNDGQVQGAAPQYIQDKFTSLMNAPRATNATSGLLGTIGQLQGKRYY